MPKHTWSITLNPYDVSGKSHLIIKADTCNVDTSVIYFHRNEGKTEHFTWDDSYLVACIPMDRVMEVELLDNETGEPIGFVPND
jgi:hypothetical protein